MNLEAGPENRPRDVRVEVAGVQYRLDETISYLGVRDGMSVFRLLGPAHERFRGNPVLHIGELPPRTTLQIGIIDLDDGMRRFARPGEQGGPGTIGWLDH